MSGHTPGPWVVLPEEDDKPYIRVRGTRLGCRYKVANVLAAEYESEDYTVELRANARLIAAAPEILKALEDYVEFFSGTYQNTGSEFQALRASGLAAIAKATQP